MFFIMQYCDLDEISSPQGCANLNRKDEFWPKFGVTRPKELLFDKKLFAAVSINSGNNIVHFGGLTLMEYYSSIFELDYKKVAYLYFL